GARLSRKNHLRRSPDPSDELIAAWKAQHHILADSSLVHCQAAKGYAAGQVLKINELKQSVLNSSLRKQRIPPSLRYGATFPGSRTRRSSKSEGGFWRSRRILLPQPASLTNLNICERCRLIAVT